MKHNRMVRVNRLLQTTLADMIPSMVKDPRVQKLPVISVVEVRTTPDLRFAKVYLSIVAPSNTEQEAALEGIRRAKGFLRGELGRRVRLRYTPDLDFLLDSSQDNAARVEAILRELSHESDRDRSSSIDEVVESIERGRKFLVMSHPNPDGDAVGSMVAMLLMLESMGREVVAYSPDPIPHRFRFLKGAERITHTYPEGPFDTSIVLDCSDSGLMEQGGVDPSTLTNVVVIDHHKTPGDFGDIVLVDPSAASVGVLLVSVFEQMELTLSLDVAEALYCSVMSDTGSFRYQNTNAEAMRVVASLLELGVDPWYISSNVYEERPRCELELLSLVLQTLVVSDDGRAASLTVTEQMLQQTGSSPDMIDGFINYARGIKGVEVAVLLRPGRSGVRVSLRSRGEIDVSRLAEQFGGGGHHNAAGFTVGQDPEQLREEIFVEVARLLSRSSANPS